MESATLHVERQGGERQESEKSKGQEVKTEPGFEELRVQGVEGRREVEGDPQISPIPADRTKGTTTRERRKHDDAVSRLLHSSVSQTSATWGGETS